MKIVMKKSIKLSLLRLFLLLTTVIIPITSFAQNKDSNNEQAKNEMLAIDREFSDYSEKHGVVEAFGKYMTDDAITYREQSIPIEGKEKFIEILSQDPDGTLTWEPFFADIASSGDLGYTLGKWEFSQKNEEGKDQKIYGYYVTIWKKQPDDSWKFVFDTGVTGPADENK